MSARYVVAFLLSWVDSGRVKWWTKLSYWAQTHADKPCFVYRRAEKIHEEAAIHGCDWWYR